MGEEVGTLFIPHDTTLCGRKRWIAFTKSPKGNLIIDQGAVEALTKRGKSLLPSGIKEVRGSFSLGDSVVLMDEKGLEIGAGMVNYTSGDIKKIMGLKSTAIESRLGFKHDDEVIHRDNLVIINDLKDGDNACQLRY